MGRRCAIALILAAPLGCGPAYAGPPYVLIDAETRAAENPSTFEIPTRFARTSRKVGELVKVGIELPPGAPPRAKGNGERMWYTIVRVDPGPRYEGTLDNDQVVFTELKPGFRLSFGTEHILSILEEK